MKQKKAESYNNSPSAHDGRRSRSRPQSRFKPKADRRLKKVFKQIGRPEEAEFVPDPFQIEAVEHIAERDVLVSAPTGSGKTWIAVQAIGKVFNCGGRSWYASPLKALSNSKYFEFCELFGSEHVGILTGDRKENTDASILVGTTEILRNHLYDAMNTGIDFSADLVVLDEAHYLGDADRGVVWEEVMIYLPGRVRLLMLSASVQNDREIASWLSEIRNHPCKVVHSDERPVPLYPLYLLPSGELLPLSGFDGVTPKIEQFLQQAEKIRHRRASTGISYEHILSVLDTFNLLPAIFFLKSRAECNFALNACKNRIVSASRTRSIEQRLESILQHYPFLANHPHIKRLQYHALGSHHGGQLIHWKIVIETLMNEGYLDAIFSTSTVAAGVNFPARTVVLVQSDRFNGKEFVDLSATELHQALGRAGRRGKDNIGFAVMVHGPYQNPHLIDDLLSQPSEPIKSQIKINFSMCLNLLLSQSPDNVKSLLERSFGTFQNIEPLKQLKDKMHKATEVVQQNLDGARCDTFSDVIPNIESRKILKKRLSRLKKKRKRYIKSCVKVDVDPDSDEKVSDFNKKIDASIRQLESMPCSGCSAFPLCHKNAGQGFIDIVYNAKWFSESYERARNELWNEFRRHLDFLILTGFAGSDGSLTNDGIWASKLRLDQPLIIAELIRNGVLTNLSSELLAGIVAVFVNDKFRDIDLDSTVQWERRPLLDAYYSMKRAVEPLMDLKKRHSFDTPLIQFWPAAALYMWACLESWETVIQLTSIDEGDLAMLIFRTADNLRQIMSLESTHPRLAQLARTSISRLLREPVIIPV